MAVLKQTSPTAEPSAPAPRPSMTVPSARTRMPVVAGAGQPELKRAGARGDVLSGCTSSTFVGARRTVLKEGSAVKWRPVALTCGTAIAKRWRMGLREDINNALKEAMKSGD